MAQAKLNKGGSSISFRLDFADGSRAAFKPEQINPQTVPRKEVAAYRINRWLGFNAVPPATMRTLHRDDLVGKLPPDAAFLATRINAETTFDAEGLHARRGQLLDPGDPRLAPGHARQRPQLVALDDRRRGDPARAGSNLMEQLSSLLLFDLLTNNSDRFSGGNLMTSKDGKVLFWMDNTFGFQIEPEGHLRCRTYLFRCQKFSRKMVAALRRLRCRRDPCRRSVPSRAS